jgi:hypothetical protein
MVPIPTVSTIPAEVPISFPSVSFLVFVVAHVCVSVVRGLACLVLLCIHGICLRTSGPDLVPVGLPVGVVGLSCRTVYVPGVVSCLTTKQAGVSLFVPLSLFIGGGGCGLAYGVFGSFVVPSVFAVIGPLGFCIGAVACVSGS